MFVMFGDFFMVEQIFLSPQVKRKVIISNKPVSLRILQKLGSIRAISDCHRTIA